MAIEGTGIKTPSKESSRMAMATYRVDPLDKLNRDIEKNFRRLRNEGSTGAEKMSGRGMGDRFNPSLDGADASNQIEKRSNFFSPGGGAFDERNDIKVAQVGSNFSNLTTDTGTKTAQPLSPIGSEAYNKELEGFKEGFKKDFNYRRRYDLDTGEEIDKYFQKVPGGEVYGEKEMERDYPTFRKFRYERNPLQYEQGVPFGKKEEKKPSLLERTANLAGSIFNTVTGTQPVAASQVGGEIPKGTQFTSSNLDAAKAPTGDTSFASYRMAGGGKQQEEKTVVSPTVKPQYEINRTENRPSVGGTAGTGDTSFSAYVRGGGEGQQRGIVSPVSTGAPRQTVASLPSDYKQTEAREFAKAKAFQQAKKNPNVKVGVDSKGQPTATAVQKGRGEDGTSDRTAQGNQARVQQNAKARAQAAAYNRKMSGKSISQVKAANRQSMRDSAAERQKAFKKTGKSTVGARRAAAKKSVQAAAKKRNAAFKKRRAARRKSRRGRRGGRR